MKSKGNIVFLGMMGSGKTFMGKLISRKLKLKFFDIDNEIEKKKGNKISKIFADKGEDYFRKLEEKTTLKILNKKNVIIALGGGGFLNKRIRDEILLNHLSFWLDWDSEVLIKRIKNSLKRPIAFNATENELFEIIKKRTNIYSKALHKINCNNLTEDQIAKKVLDIYEAN